MAKFIIEVSDGYIRERADMENIIANCDGSEDIPHAMLQVISFSNLEHELKKGVREFTLSSEQFIESDPRVRNAFNHLVEMLAISVMAKDVDDRRKEVE